MQARTSGAARWRLTALFVAAIGSAVGAMAVSQTGPQERLPAANWEPTGPVITWRGISFIVPAGMRGTDKGDLYEMIGQGVTGRMGQCAIVIGREVAAGPEPVRQAHEVLVANVASIGQRVANSRGESDLTIERRGGYSADGWKWIEISGMLGAGIGDRARLMLITRGATVVPIMAFATGGNGCVGLVRETTPFNNTVTWAGLYHSLKLAGSTPSPHHRDWIVGGWESLAGSTKPEGGISSGETFAPDGRYARVSVVAGPGFEKAGFGDGRYVVAGNRLATFPDRGPAETTLMRIVADHVATTPPRTMLQLCRITVDVGGPRERCVPRREP